MSEQADLNRVRSAALHRIERSERNFKLILCAAALLEALFLLTLILMMDRGNKLHLFLFVTTFGSYTLIVMGLIVLGAHVTRNTQRILKAIELLDGRSANEMKR
jgi:hypothetical protein